MNERILDEPEYDGSGRNGIRSDKSYFYARFILVLFIGWGLFQRLSNVHYIFASENNIALLLSTFLFFHLSLVCQQQAIAELDDTNKSLFSLTSKYV